MDRVDCQLPRMADLYAGPNTPLSKAFIFCGWETISVDWMLDSSHDLSNSLRQQSLHEQLQSVCFIAAALDCSTKSRASEIPRDFGDGRPPPRPLRSEKHPLGLPELTGSQRNRVERDNAAASFVLSEIDQLVDREVDQSARTRTTASTGGHRMRLQCGTVVVGQTSDTQHVASEVPGRNCSACAITLLRLPSGHGPTATIFMTRKNGNHGFRTVNVTTHQPRSRSIRRSFALPLQLRPLGGQCVWATPSYMCRVHRPPAVLATGIIGLIWILELSVNGL